MERRQWVVLTGKLILSMGWVNEPELNPKRAEYGVYPPPGIAWNRLEPVETEFLQKGTNGTARKDERQKSYLRARRMLEIQRID